MAYKLDIFKMLKAIDNKDYDFFDTLSEEELKGFSAILGLKWSVNVSSGSNTQHYYLTLMNHCANKYLFDIHRHPKLQYLTLVAASPNHGSLNRKWVGIKKKPNKSKDDIIKQLKIIYPQYKEEDITLLSTMITKRDLTKYRKDSGN
jgi:hypothetical protein